MTSERTAGVRVLVVDDCASFRQTARDLLECRGYVVVGEADCASAAREAVHRLLPDAILLDVHLPDGDGIELAEDLHRANPTIAVLLVSADQVEHRLRQTSSARGFVAKAKLAQADLARFWPSPALAADSA